MNWRQIQDCPHGPKKKEGDIRLELTTEDRETDEGKTQIIRCNLLRPTSSYFNGYHMEDYLPDHQFFGYIEGITEEGGQSRIVAKGREVWTITPEIVWPEH